MGQTTYGKGSIQCLIQLKKAPLDKLAGIRLTVAKLFSPSNVAINGRGITPDEPLPLNVDSVERAKKYLAGLLKPMGMMMSEEDGSAPAASPTES
jgi:carboxyl-terminal processing protease